MLASGVGRGGRRRGGIPRETRMEEKRDESAVAASSPQGGGRMLNVPPSPHSSLSLKWVRNFGPRGGGGAGMGLIILGKVLARAWFAATGKCL